MPVKYICDNCQKECNPAQDDFYLLQVNVTKLTLPTKHDLLVGQGQHIHCEKCMEELLNKIHSYVKEQPKVDLTIAN